MKNRFAFGIPTVRYATVAFMPHFLVFTREIPLDEQEQ